MNPHKRDEWPLRLQLFQGKKVYFLMHECSFRQFSSTVTVKNEDGVVVEKCFSCAKEAPKHKILIRDLSK